MKKLAAAVIVVIPSALAAWAFYLMITAPPSLPMGVRLSHPDLFEAEKAIADRAFLKAAYAMTWAVQLGYLAWLGLKWRAQKRDSTRSDRLPR